jgi:hypothetical protein
LERRPPLGYKDDGDTTLLRPVLRVPARCE